MSLQLVFSTRMAINIKINSIKSANLSLHQNYVPIIRSIEVDNQEDLEYENLVLKIFSDPNDLAFAEIPITTLRAQETLCLTEPKLIHSWSFFRSVKERIVGSLSTELFDQEEEKISSHTEEILIEPETVWLGQNTPLELLCSHIMPNGDTIQTIMRRAADLLKIETGNSALSGYQTKSPKRVDEVAQSIFLALREKNISYATAPASFESQGQKVRTPYQVINQGIGNCLDLSLLYASCLEQAGIHSLIFLIEGHAFVGYWLEDKYMPRAVDEDPQFFRKRLELSELVVLDVVGITSDYVTSYSNLEKSAATYLNDDEKFEAGIDVSYCRTNRKIYPLNDLDEKNSIEPLQREENEQIEGFESREFETFLMPKSMTSRAEEVEKWKEKLLDLSFRNRLLNFKSQRNTLEILCHSLADIEDILADGSEFEILPELIENNLSSQRTDFEQVREEQITNHFQKKKLLSKIKEDRFASTLTGLYRSAINAEEETGANTLFLALGILSWTETEGSQISRRSPLLLLPVHLKRKYVGGRFFLALRGDETVINHTLLQKLKRDFNFEFPGLDPLPQDDSGVDVKLIFNIIRKVIRDKRGWEVKEEVWLSEFSFQKFLMWKELDEHYDAMLESPIIRRIMTSEVPEDSSHFIRESEVEVKSHPKETFCPLSADSSQMAAILSAASGKSFVLQGPPGTGKSQTIANMIAHCMAVGKKVLFVSEKKVALEVVYRRLQEIGVGQFCLELHSKKSERKAVINSFFEALEYQTKSHDQEWNRISEELVSSRDDLNRYFEELHHKSPIGISAYEAFTKARRSKDYPKIEFDFESFLDLPEGHRTDLTLKLDKWLNQSLKLSEKDFKAWSGVLQDIWSVRIEDELSNRLEVQLEQAEDIQGFSKASPVQLPVNLNWTPPVWSEFATMLRLLLEMPILGNEFLRRPDFNRYCKDCYEAMDLLKEQYEFRNSILEEFNDSIFNENIKELKVRYDKANEGMFFVKYLRKRSFKKSIKSLVVGDIEEWGLYEPILAAGVKCQRQLSDQEKAESALNNCFSQPYELELDTQHRKAMQWAKNLLEKISFLYSMDLPKLSSVKETVSNLIENRSLVLANHSAIQKEMRSAISTLENFDQTLSELKSNLSLAFDISEVPIWELTDKITLLLQSFSCFRDVASMNSLRNELSQAGLKSLFVNLDQDEFSRSDTIEVFEYNLHRQWLEEKTNDSETLSKVTGNQLTGWDESFKKIDRKYEKVTRKALSAKISKDKPALGEMVIPNTPLGVIARESKKSRGHMHIRKFLDTIDPVAKKLKSCYLMSPMSVSQYLPVRPDFDIVIFDEASQIPPWDAIGALSRGAQAVVVGDVKQLPPTSFFSMSSEDESDETIDCESVLEMFSTMFPEMLLKWHYRSRSESLISFSNFHIYGNRLHTFPSYETNDNKVSLKVLPFDKAYYDRGKTRTNKGEARVVVDEIFRILKSKTSTNSIGVVTFSSVQANLISDLIDERLQKETQFESFFDAVNQDYVFVKNLENVQGDERDIILFSVGYGKDSLGKLSKNFGPLNNSGGERRLNVAITRAREEVKIFCNFHPRDFDTSSSGAEGIRLLKEYLFYASNGPGVLVNREKSNLLDNYDSPFETEVAHNLSDRGWKIRSQIGVGGYRIDIGVIHPDHPGQFLAGIECDGARYHSAKSARDRDILRQSVLEGLGWNILRIWSTDWWYDSHKCLEKIESDLNLLIIAGKENVQLTKNIELEEEEHELDIDITQENIHSDVDILRYDVSVLKLESLGDFFEKPWFIKKQIEHVVDSLAPISKEECFAIIRKSCGYARTGKRIENYLNDCIKGTNGFLLDSREFFWRSANQAETTNALRMPIEGEQRHPTSIAPEELACGVLTVLKVNITVRKEDLLKQVAKMLGFSRISKENVEAMMPALTILIDKNLAQCEEDIVTFIG